MRSRGGTIREEELYEDIRVWFQRYMNAKFKQQNLRVTYWKVFDTHGRYLCEFISRNILPILGKDASILREKFYDFSLWYIKVDLFGVALLETYKEKELIFAIIEVKNEPLNLSHLAQIIGYSMIVRPEISMLISSHNISDNLRRILVSARRYDILRYRDRSGKQRTIGILKWNVSKRDIDMYCILPEGYLSQFI